MCQICDGASIDEVRKAVDRKIDLHGWVVQAVEGGADSDPWAYTIGLVEQFQHPELVVTSLDATVAGRLLDDLAERVRGGERFAPGSTDVGGVEVHFVPVHPWQFANGLFAMWFDHYRRFGSDDLLLSALQVIIPGWPYCSRHAHRAPRLDRSEPAVGGPRPNRAQRRARERSRLDDQRSGVEGRRQAGGSRRPPPSGRSSPGRRR